MADLAAPVPAYSTPFLKDGLVNEPWYRFLAQLQRRTGGGGGIDISVVEAQVNFQSVVPEDALSQQNQRGVDDLWGQSLQAPNNSDLLARMAEFEQSAGLNPQQLTEFNRLVEQIAFLVLQPPPAQQSFVEAFISPTLVNGWVNFGAPFNSAGYYKDPFGIVHLRGVIKNGTINTAAFVLPIGYRPSATELPPAISNNNVGAFNIDASGNVVPVVGVSTYITLDSITFRAA